MIGEGHGEGGTTGGGQRERGEGVRHICRRCLQSAEASTVGAIVTKMQTAFKKFNKKEEGERVGGRPKGGKGERGP